jgi:biotin carboxyl carrier protein
VRVAAQASPSPSGAPRKRVGAAGAAGSLNAPMPGVILEVNVKTGDVVERGHIVAILEAMKMNNAIKAPRAGTIAEVFVSAGQAVSHGEPLIRFQEG